MRFNTLRMRVALNSLGGRGLQPSAMIRFVPLLAQPSCYHARLRELSLPGTTAMHSWRIALPLRCFFALAVVVSLAMAIVLATSTSSLAEGEPKRVLMLHSFGLRFKPWTDYAHFIRSGITHGSQTPVDFHDHSLLNARLADDKAD